MSDKPTSEQVKKKVPNPTGKGGFVKGESGNPGGRPKDNQRYDYWLQHFKNMTEDEFATYLSDKKKGERYLAERQALNYFIKSEKDFYIFKTIADRTEGKPQQYFDHTNDGQKFDPVIIYRPEKLED